jgi:hypothetical protein
MRVNILQPTIHPTEHVGVTLDLNSDGRRDWEFYFSGTSGGQLRHVRYPGGTFENTPASLGTFSGNANGVTFNLRLAALGSPARFQFDAFTKERDEPTIWDIAPDTGWWSFEVGSTQPPPPPPPPGGGGGDFAARGTVIAPDPPRAGDVVGVGTSFRFKSNRQPVRGGSVTCEGSIGSQPISGVPLRDSGLHACFFDLPRNSGGKLFTGRVIMTVGARERSAQRKARIVDASAMQLTNLKTLNGSGGSPPAAGQNFSASVKVALVRPGSSSRPIRDGLVRCPATVGGKSIGTYFKGFVQGRATCSWNIPASARGSVFQGTILVVSGGKTATKTFTSRVR